MSLYSVRLFENKGAGTASTACANSILKVFKLFSHILTHPLLSIHLLQPPILTKYYSHDTTSNTNAKDPKITNHPMDHSNQDAIIMHSEKHVEFTMRESDTDTDSEMSGSDFGETMNRSQGRHIKFAQQQPREEYVIPTTETQPPRAIRMPKSWTAKAVKSRHSTPTPARDASITSPEAQAGNSGRRPRARSSTPKPERVSKRKRGLEPSNSGLPMHTASTPKRARKYKVPCKAPDPAAPVVGTVIKKEEQGFALGVQAPVAVMSAPAVEFSPDAVKQEDAFTSPY